MLGRVQAFRAVNLPLEIKYMIISCLDTSSLVATLRANKALSAEAERYLYKDVCLSKDQQIEGFHYALSHNAERAKRVQICTILDFSVVQHSLVHHVLKAMSNLRSLAMIPAVTDLEFSQGWDAILTGCDFKLLEFITSFDCDHALANFLVTQTNIELYIHSGYTPTHSANVFHDPLVLPSLKRFRGNVMDLNTIIPQRPVTHVTVQESIAAIGLTHFVLRPLRDSKGPIEYLSLSLMDTIDARILQVIQAHTPHISTLELSAPRASVRPHDPLPEIEWFSALITFKHLEHFTYETSLDPAGVAQPIPHCEQEILARAWSESSPALRTIDFSTEVLGDGADSTASKQDVDRWTFTKKAWIREAVVKSLSENMW